MPPSVMQNIQSAFAGGSTPCPNPAACYLILRSLTAHGGLTDNHGHPLTPAEEARRFAAVISTTRFNKTAAGAPEPQGELVTANIETEGLAGKDLSLSWSVLQLGGTVPLADEWQATRLNYRVRSTTDRDTGSLSFWVPSPAAPGQYLVRVTLAVGGTDLASIDSPSFN